jgi:alpha-L-fucosidase
LNVGPKADGTFPQESIQRLKEVGAWMKVNGEAIYATKASPLKPLSWGRCTKKENGKNTTLYLSVFNWPADGRLVVPGLTQQVISAKLLSDGTKLKTEAFISNATGTEDGTAILLPAKAPDAIASVIKVEVKGTLSSEAKAKDKMKTGELD